MTKEEAQVLLSQIRLGQTVYADTDSLNGYRLTSPDSEKKIGVLLTVWGDRHIDCTFIACGSGRIITFQAPTITNRFSDYLIYALQAMIK